MSAGSVFTRREYMTLFYLFFSKFYSDRTFFILIFEQCGMIKVFGMLFYGCKQKLLESNF